MHEGITRVNNLNINNEIDNDIHKALPFPWRSDKDAYLITQLWHIRPLRHASLFGSWRMLDSADISLNISWWRQGWDHENAEWLLYNSSTQHLWSAPGRLPNTWRDFFLKFNTSILWMNGLKYDMGCYIKIQIFNLIYIISSSCHQSELIDILHAWLILIHLNTHFHLIHILQIDAL